MPSGRRLLSVVPMLAALVPPALVARVVARDAVNVPFMDQWVFGGSSVANAARGLFTLASLWEPNNEHRVVLPRLVMLGLARLTRWDVRYEQATSVLLALGTLALLTALVARTVRPLAPRIAGWMVLVAALQTFSMAQWQNWTWGWQLSIFLNVFAATAAVCGLARWGPAWPGVPWIVLAALAAALSFASGLAMLVLVPVGFLALGGRKAGEQAGVTAVIGAAFVALYFTDFHPVGNPPPRVLPYQAPLGFYRYVAAYLGAGFAAGRSDVATAWGTAGLLALALAVAVLWRRSPAHRTAMVPWVLLALYAVLAGVLTAVGRLGGGASTALLSRYTTISAPFWTSVAVLIGLALADAPSSTWARWFRLAAIGVTGVALCLAAAGYRRTWTLGDQKSLARAADERRALGCLPTMETAPDACLRLVCWDANILRFFGGPLKTLRLGPFAPRG